MQWIKSHKLILVLLLVIFYLVFANKPSPLLLSRTLSPQTTNFGSSPVGTSFDMGAPASVSLKSSAGEVAQSDNRVVIQDSSLSLLVNDVRSVGDRVIAYAKQQGGYMVNTSYTRPTESPFASITVRIPTEKLDEALKYYRSLGVKVTSENLMGTDVTAQYTDIVARLETLAKTKAKFEDILNKATLVQDIVSVQQQLINIEDQIDSYKGQQKLIDENAKLTRITIYLSTDELALPYTPDKVFRPGVIFKEAVRSLVGTIQSVGEWLIWIAVYSPIIIVAILVYIGYRKWNEKRLLKLKN